MSFKHSLKFFIENKRRDMIEAANHYGMNAEITIKYSQELDELLNQYLRVVMESKKEKVAL